MRLVIDANIVFAALIKESKTRELIFDSRLELVAPFTLWIEIEKYRRTLEKKAQLNRYEFNELLTILQRYIKTIPKQDLQETAEKVVAYIPDVKDTYYLVTAMILEIPLWSNDKLLKQFQRVQILSSHELIEELNQESMKEQPAF